MQTLYDLVLSNILKEMQKQNKSQKELTDYLDVSKSTFTDWKSGKSKSFMKHLPQIAEFFQVPVDFLTDKKNKTAPSEQPMSPKQQLLFDIVADLTDDELKKVIEYADLLNLRHNQ